MNSYYCIVNMPGVPSREIHVLSARTDRNAEADLRVVASHWIGFDTIYLYQGERLVEVVSNPALGFPQDPLPFPVERWDVAA